MLQSLRPTVWLAEPMYRLPICLHRTSKIASYELCTSDMLFSLKNSRRLWVLRSMIIISDFVIVWNIKMTDLCWRRELLRVGLHFIVYKWERHSTDTGDIDKQSKELAESSSSFLATSTTFHYERVVSRIPHIGIWCFIAFAGKYIFST